MHNGRTDESESRKVSFQSDHGSLQASNSQRVPKAFSVGSVILKVFS